MELNERKIVEMNSDKDGVIEKSTEALNILKSPNYNSINSDSRIDLLDKEEKSSQNFYERNTGNIYKCGVLLLLLAYFIWATYYQIFVLNTNIDGTFCTGYGFLMAMYGVIAFCLSYNYLLEPKLLPSVKENIWNPLVTGCHNNRYSVIVFYFAFFGGFGIFLIIDTENDRYRLVSLLGVAVFLVLGYLICPFKSSVNWRTIINGMVLQFSLALLIIKCKPGEQLFNCLGEKVTTFLGYAVQGAAFVYGNDLVYKQGVFAFKSLCTIYFLGFCINILYYYGWMQKFVSNLGKFFKFWLGTSMCESVNSAANIFLGMTEAPLLLKPFLQRMTDSEMHNIMCCGFATTSGTVLAAYISFGANAATLITASVMSAPSALVYSKLIYPETETPEITQDNVHLTEMPFDSVLDAAITGASDAVKMVLGIISGIIACLSFVYFLNGILAWMGILVGYTNPNDQWSLTLFVGDLFVPLAFLMGVPPEDCNKVGELIAIKMTINEFVAFQRMGTMTLLPKSRTIATFAICGFANPGSVGIMISGLSALVPEKRPVITRLVFRAAAGGAIVCFMTACIAGLVIPTNIPAQPTT